MPAPLVDKAADAAQMASAPVVYGVAGATFFGITFEEWVLLGTAVLLVFNLIFAVFKLRDLIRRYRNEDEH